MKTLSILLSQSVIALFVFFMLGKSTLSAQNYEVDITISDYTSDTLIVGYYFGERQLVSDTLYSKNQKNFKWTGDEPLHSGVYLILTTPGKNFFQFFIDEPYPKFSLKTNAELRSVEFKKSEDNTTFNEYVTYITRMKELSEPLKAKLETANESEKEDIYKQLDQMDLDVQAKQLSYIEQHPNTFTAKSIKASLPIDFPDPPAGLSDNEYDLYRFENYRAHYFDHVDLGDSTLLYTPFLDTRINYYIDKLTVQLPDSLISSIDYLLGQMHPNSQMFRYYLSNIYNKYIQSKMVGMDAVVVHIADNYYAKGLAPWIEEDVLEKILDNANKARPSLIGATAQDIQLELKDGSPIKLSDIDSEFLVLLFWAPDCGHCTKSMPAMIEFEETYRDQNVKVLSVCTKYQEKIPKCWAGTEEKGMTNFINAVDPVGKSRFKTHFDIRTTPKIFVLNKDLKILIKGIGADQLSDVMSDIIRRESK